MNYRSQALILGIMLIAAGASVLVYALSQAQAATSPVEASIIAFTGLGLILIGSLVSFAAPQPLVFSEIVSRAIAPHAENLALIFDSTLPKSRGRTLHVPMATLGGESQVFLVLSSGPKVPLRRQVDSDKGTALTWNTNSKVLEPIGIALMKSYEKVLKRDFFGLEPSQLARLLGKAIVPELQLASGFSLNELPDNGLQAVWTKSTIAHSCVLNQVSTHPEVCCLCSSVACALAKATGKSIWIEESKYDEPSLSVKTIYRLSR